MPPRRRPRRVLLRVVVVWIVTAAALWLSAAIFAGVTVEDAAAAFASAALIALVNAALWPLAIRLLLPITVLTLGLGALVLNGGVILLVASLDPGLHVDSLGAAIGVAFVLTVVTTAATSLLAIDDDEPFYRNVIKRQARRGAHAVESDVPGLLLLEVDGLAHDVIARAMRDGNAPTLARWLREDGYHLTRWEADWSSQTGACQAGLLHGDNDDMPAFRWWEKEHGKAIVTNHPRDAEELERRHSNGRGLLFSNGASRANILSGDAPHSLLTMSTALRRDRPGRIGQDYFAYFANPYNVLRTAALVAREVLSERWAAIQQKRRGVEPPLLRRAPQLAHHFAEHQRDRAHDRVRAREVGEVVLADAALTVAPQHRAHRQQAVRGVARHDVGAACAVVEQQAAAVRVPALQLHRVARVVGHDRRATVLLPPAERRHVVVVAVQEPRLAGPGLRRPVGLPASE